MTNPVTHDDIDRCPICAEPFKPEDNCATDIELGTCHFDCLDGSPVVDLETGEEIPDDDMHSFPYSDVMDPPPQEHTVVDLDAEIASVVQSVNEWDDRTSPEDYPDHLLITSEELAKILRNFADTLGGRNDG